MGKAAKPKMQCDFLNSDILNLEEIKKTLKKKSDDFVCLVPSQKQKQ